ncbi:hypothetical protein MBANPS3_004361 [Mucor bainieri]
MAPPTTTMNSNNYSLDDQFSNANRQMQRMHLHDISETSEVHQPHYHQQQPRSNPKDNLMNLTQRVSNEELKQAIRVEIKRLVSDYDRLISVLQQRSEILEQEYENLQLTEDSYQRRYEKAVREMQFFKKKYDKAAELNKQYASINGTRPRSPSMDSSSSSLHNSNNPAYSNSMSPPPSSTSGSEGAMYHTMPPPPLPNSPLPMENKNSRHLSRSSSSSTTSSNNSGTPLYWTAYTSELSPAPPVPRLRQNSSAAPASIHSASTDGDSSSSKYMSSRKGSWQHMQQPSISSSNASQAPANANILSTPTTPSSATSATGSNGPQPGITRSTTNASQAGYVNNSVVQQRKVDPIAFGGSDALWETIAKSKTADSTIEKMISNFLRRGGSPNTAKQSSSHKAVKYGYGMIHTLIVVKASTSLDLLLQHGANPNAMTLSQVEDDKVTPAYLAASLGWLPGLQALVEAGADLCNARGAGLKNKTALHVAAEHCHTPIVEYIVSLTPPKYHSQVDSMGASALHYASASGHTDLVSFLIQACQLPVDQVDIRGEVPLHWASRHGHLEVASLLIERCGCDFNSYIPRKSGTPYDLAKAGGHKRLIEYYKKIGALTAKKMDKKREEEAEKNVPVHLESALSKNGLFGF